MVKEIDAQSVDYLTTFLAIKEEKASKGFDNVDLLKRKFYNFVNWMSLYRKGLIMLESYNNKILPNVVRTLAVQHKFKLVNGEGDEVVAIADLIVEWIDGRILLLDNKTSSREYDQDQAARSQQLIIYHYQLREEFKLSPDIGFIVMNKNIMKNKFKVCSKCGFNGTGSRARTCPEEIEEGRCSGEWLEKINPECYIQTIINPITETAENLVLSAFDEANEGITKQFFYKNLSHCVQGPIKCQFYRLCWKQDFSDVVKNSK